MALGNGEGRKFMKLYANARKQVAEVYARMAAEANYRPAAPSDGFGNITGPLDLPAEQEKYAVTWWQDEDSGHWHIGVPDMALRKVMILCVEAAKGCCSSEPELTGDLLKLAQQELTEVRGG